MRVYIKLILITSITFAPLFFVTPVLAAELTIQKSADKSELEADTSNNTAKYTLTVSNTSKCDQPIDVMIVFDRSGSMDDDNEHPPQPLNDAKSVARRFANSMRQGDQVGLVSYATDATLDAQLDDNHGSVISGISTIRADGYTNIGDGIKVAAAELNSSRHNPSASRHIVIFSDGEANRPESNAKQYAISQAANAKADGINIISVALGDEADTNLMRSIASPGQYYYSPTIQQMSKIYDTISKNLLGTSSQTVVSDDLSDILAVADIVDIDNGGKLVGNKIVWEIGDLACGAVRTVSFRARLHANPGGDGDLINRANTTNDSGNNSNSNQVVVKYKYPVLTIAHTDNVEITKVGNTLEYVTTITNKGSGPAKDFKVCATIPTGVILESIANGGKQQGDQVCWEHLNLNPGEQLELRFKVEVGSDFADGYSTLVSIAKLTNNELQIDAKDTTQVFVQPKPLPNFSLQVKCVDINDDETYTVHFNYTNELSETQTLTESKLIPDTATGTPVSELKTGQHEDVFTATANIAENVTWSATAGSVKKTATANSKFTPCTLPETPTTPPDPTVNPIPEAEPETVIGTPVVRVTTRSAAPNPDNAPTVRASDASVRSCQTKRITLTNCQASDDVGVETMQYSLDGGKSWQPITQSRGLGSKNVSCQIETKPLADGNYDLVVRARDNAGKWGSSQTNKINVNCEGIVIGANHPAVKSINAPFTTGSGELLAISSVPLAMAIEIAGGPTAAKIVVQETNQEFPLAYNRDLNLWQTEIKVNEPGSYHLVAVATESNGQGTSREINTLRVIAASSFVQTDATVTLFSRQNSSENWKEWRGADFNQSANFQLDKVNNAIYVTAGEYYARVEKAGFHPANTDIIKVDRNSYLSLSGELLPNRDIFDWMFSLTHEVKLNSINTTTQINTSSKLLNQPAPAIKLITSKEQLDNKTFTGQLNLVVAWNQWSPIAVEQLLALETIAKTNPELKIYVVNTLINPDESSNYLERGTYSFNFFRTDPNFYRDWQVNSLPINYLINQDGVIKGIYNGVLKPVEYGEMKTQAETIRTNQ